MNRNRIISCLLLLISLSACTPSAPEIPGFEAYVWKRDKWGCGQDRAILLPSLLEAKDQIMGLREAEVLRLLGKADQQELYERSQKFLIYYVEPGKNCSNTEGSETGANALYIRVNSIGIANELFVRPGTA